jgi:quercetin dioxygenase-like cupin family protein
MPAVKLADLPVTVVKPGVERRLAHTDRLMIVTVDFSNGPQSEPDPPHAHPHEQVSAVVEGEILFVTESERTRLGPGDMFVVPSGQPHAIQLLSKRIRLIDCFTPIREDFLP